MKKTVLAIAMILAGFTAFCQDIKIKDNTVFIDDKECLKISSSDPNNVTFLDLDGNELFFLKFIHDTKYADLYNRVIFIEQKKSFTSKNYIYTKKLLIARLLKEKILVDCKINQDKVDNFILKFDENVEQK